MRVARDREGGFTLIELLVAVLIIGTLSAVALAVYNGQREKSYIGRETHEAVLLERAIHAARINQDARLMTVTGSTWTNGPCDSGNPSGIWPADLPKTDPCWTRYQLTIDRIAAASGMNLDEIRNGDINGNPFIIDENDGEKPSPPCRYDIIGVYIGGKFPNLGRTNYFTGGPSPSAYNSLRQVHHLVTPYQEPGC